MTYPHLQPMILTVQPPQAPPSPCGSVSSTPSSTSATQWRMCRTKRSALSSRPITHNATDYFSQLRSSCLLVCGPPSLHAVAPQPSALPRYQLSDCLCSCWGASRHACSRHWASHRQVCVAGFLWARGGSAVHLPPTYLQHLPQPLVRGVVHVRHVLRYRRWGCMPKGGGTGRWHRRLRHRPERRVRAVQHQRDNALWDAVLCGYAVGAAVRVRAGLRHTHKVHPPLPKRVTHTATVSFLCAQLTLNSTAAIGTQWTVRTHSSLRSPSSPLSLASITSSAQYSVSAPPALPAAETSPAVACLRHECYDFRACDALVCLVWLARFRRGKGEGA
jgi:hypothetical protein